MRIEYDNTMQETQTAFMALWKKYSIKSTLALSSAFVIFIAVAVFSIVTNDSILWWVMLGLFCGLLANIWLKPRRACKKLIQALETMDEEKYAVIFGEDSIEVETITATDTVNSKYLHTQEELYSKETQDLFLLFVNRSLIHVFPKRCMDESQAEKIRSYFEEKRI